MSYLYTDAAEAQMPDADDERSNGLPDAVESYHCGGVTLHLTTDEREEFEAMHHDLTSDTLTRGEFRDLLKFLQLTPTR
jgi:hypothetical protein